MRPRLHRYCARMVGSVIDGEDVLQDALIKAVESFASAGADRQPAGLAVPDRAQHRAGFPAPPQPAGSAALGRGGGHDCRSGRRRHQPRDRRRQPAHLHAASGRAALQRDPDGRARLLAAGNLRGDGLQPARGEGRPSSRPRPAARTRRRAGRFAAPGIVEGRSRAARRLCRALQRAGFRRYPRDDRGRCAARTRQQDAPERQGRGFQVFRKLFQSRPTGIWCRGWWKDGPRSWCSIPTSPARRRNTSCCCNGRPTRSRKSATSATRPTSSTAPNIGSDKPAKRRRAMPIRARSCPQSRNSRGPAIVPRCPCSA